MSNYQSLLEFPEGTTAPEKKKTSPTKLEKRRGCEFCPLNEMEGIHKVKNLDKIEGKRIMVWAQNPGEQENRKRKELVGPAGQLLWNEAAPVGLTRDMCDVQNCVRCWTVDRNELDQLEARAPTQEEIRCCSIYNEEAIDLNRGKARVHLVLGQVAAKALLKGEYRKDQKTFFSKKLNTWVVCTYHPSYFLRGAPRSRLKEFREALATVVAKANEKVSGRFSYIESQDYKAVPARLLEQEIEKPIREMASKGIVTAVDIEDGKRPRDEKNVIVYIGFSWKKGQARGVLLEHKDLDSKPEDDQLKFEVLKGILEDPNIPKAFQHGVYDVWKLEKLMSIKVRGFVHDTEYSEYLRFSWAKSYGLEAISDRRFRLFAGYKDILEPYKNEEGQVNFYEVPREIIVRYNGADCDLTKRIQRDNDGKVNESLLKVLILAAPVLAKMEEMGPWLDFEYAKYVDAWLPQRIKKLAAYLKKVAEDKTFNPNAPADVAHVIYDKLKLGRHLDMEWKRDYSRSTNKETMQLLANFNPFPKRVLEYRGLAKKKSTYLDAYKKSATLYGGRVRTKWWLTGTITCRLRSGGAKDKSKAIVNLQNIHGSPTVECLLVSDLRWRDLYNTWKKENRDG